ncbi:hypothetical protein KFK09_002256 [Dendrobium nobile]|uniref:Uncharacterized protein n=1 Tax=Dendrobium nobile TaxID=94219 RepID=A0A8T3CBR8_DENNO|nr:hypothetical protein KFK09_002255 [Dendrobium nobile]KAI0529700.1 hypothetical protein KFK09_002256 [Dendrobium nobile]
MENSNVQGEKPKGPVVWKVAARLAGGWPAGGGCFSGRLVVVGRRLQNFWPAKTGEKHKVAGGFAAWIGRRQGQGKKGDGILWGLDDYESTNLKCLLLEFLQDY